MNLSIYDQDMNRISIVGSAFKSCLWSEGYNTTQPFTLELDATEEYKKKVKKDCYVGRSDRPTLMVIKSVQIKGNVIIATGKQATRVLADVAYVGTIPAGSFVDKAIISAYNKSNRYRALTTIDSNLGVGYTQQISNKDLKELCEVMCQATDIGFRIVKHAGKMALQFYRPDENPNLIFSEAFGNLSFDSILDSSENYKNYAVVLGQGEGAAREKVIVDLSGGSDRREMIVDAKDLQQDQGESLTTYRKRLQARGVEKLLEKTETKEVIFTPLSKDFGKRFDLGDVLTVNVPDYGMKIKARLARFSEKCQGNATNLKIEVGEITILR